MTHRPEDRGTTKVSKELIKTNKQQQTYNEIPVKPKIIKSGQLRNHNSNEIKTSAVLSTETCK